MVVILSERSEAIRQLIEPNHLLYLESTSHTTMLKRAHAAYSLPYQGHKESHSLLTVLNRFKGNATYHLNSDVFDFDNVEIPLHSLDPHQFHNLKVKLIENALPMLEKQSLEMASAIIVKDDSDAQSNHLSITVGLINDMQVVLIDLKPKGAKTNE